MKRISTILVASLFALGAAVPAFAWTTHNTANLNHGTQLVAGAGVHKIAMASEEGSEGGEEPEQPAEPQQPPSTDDGGE